ncbi:putative glycosyl hydrolases family 18 protein 5 [Elsinoe fawcettii]|nr:putative glycosyl hydrolases family 18 protein 5 [Elsinoe fawcettii]
MVPQACGLVHVTWLVISFLVVATVAERFSALSPCPESCLPGKQQDDWTTYHTIDFLSICDQPMLLNLNVYTPLDDPSKDITIRACTVGDSNSDTNLLLTSSASNKDTSQASDPQSHSRVKRQSRGCAAVTEVKAKSTVVPALDAGGNPAAINTAIRTLQDHFKDGSSCEQTIMLAASKGSIVGLFSGSSIEDGRLMESAVQQFADKASSGNVPKAMQVCGGNRTSDISFGIVTGEVAGMDEIRNALKRWNDAECFEDTAAGAEDGEVSLWVQDTPTAQRRYRLARNLQARADCRTTKVVSGDSCASLASRCGVDGNTFMSYNTQANFCATLAVGQQVCCSSGTLPNIKPRPNADGSCAAHTVASGEYCQLIASSNGITLDELNGFNKQTWGWTGCNNLQLGIKICLSTGSPPMPASVSNAVCGPTKPGSQPSGSIALADLNPCPLKACCNIWGQCGLTDDFCVISKSETGNPGTSAPGKNGCISNCGMNIVNNGQPPAQFRKVGYFEAWNLERTCLNMDVRKIDSSYTHVHFSFAEISKDYQVLIGDNVRGQFDAFKSWQTSVKKVLAFGGWSFSTEVDSYPIFGQSVSAANRAAFADRVVQFAIDNNLDGLDFDWEYPSAPDIPGIPPGHPDDGKNYLEFLKVVRSKLPKEKTLSIAAPASYWYLKGFPIADMAPVVDYIVYMTYDLHGQWDAGNAWANPGCPAGNCLRSHVNYTETQQALAMVTKAGVSANKIVVGVSSYGRSFKMASAGCSGPSCTFLGTAGSSQAKPGRCTLTGGYISNAEIDEIIKKGGATSFHDTATDSDILIYEGTEWVAYMNNATKQSRTDKYKLLNFGGTSDWAIDLQSFIEGGKNPPSTGSTCDPSKGTFDASFHANGSYQQGRLGSPDLCKQYVTIVNLTPQSFILTGEPASYQMQAMDFATIPPGRSRQNLMHYGCGKGNTNPVDDKGEAYYKVDGTDHTFVIKARTFLSDPDPADIPWRPVVELSAFGVQPREYLARGAESAVNIVITGSADYKYYTSVYDVPVGWMQELKDVIGPRKVRNVIMPGSHDAGMSKAGRHQFGGVDYNTKTQGYNIHDQLMIGSRWFDLRVAYWSTTDTMHTVHTRFPIPTTQAQGGMTGETLAEVVDGINAFMRDHPGEVIFLSTRYFWTALDETATRWRAMDDREHGQLFDELSAIERRCKNLGGNIDEVLMQDLMKDGGCVVILLDETEAGYNPTKDDPGRGIYIGANGKDSRFRRNDFWPQKKDPSQMVDANIKSWEVTRTPGSTAPFQIAQWFMSDPDLADWGDIFYSAVFGTYDPLFWKGVDGMSPTGFPNVILLNYLGSISNDQGSYDWELADHEIRALVMGLNLYMVSENCDISNISNPLRKPKANMLTSPSAMINDKVMVDEQLFNAIDFSPQKPLVVADERSNVTRIDNSTLARL